MKTGQGAVRSIPMTPKADSSKRQWNTVMNGYLLILPFFNLPTDDYFLFAHGSHRFHGFCSFGAGQVRGKWSGLWLSLIREIRGIENRRPKGKAIRVLLLNIKIKRRIWINPSGQQSFSLSSPSWRQSPQRSACRAARDRHTEYYLYGTRISLISRMNYIAIRCIPSDRSSTLKFTRMPTFLLAILR